MAGQIDRFERLDRDGQLRALARPGLGDQDYFWDLVNQPLAEQLGARLATLASAASAPPDFAASLAVVRSPNAREKLPNLEGLFASMPWTHRLPVATARPDGYFVPTAIEFLKEAGSFRSGELAGLLLLQHAEFLTLQTLQSALNAWADNLECRSASGMPRFAVELFQRTARLGVARKDAFTKFLADVQAYAAGDEGDYYKYPALETAMRSAGYLP